jgi:hypothetical protein
LFFRKSLIHLKIAYTLTGALLSDKSPSRSSLVLSMLFLVSFISGKAVSKASLILAEIFLILSD